MAATLAEGFRPVKLATAMTLVALFGIPLCALPTAARDPQEPAGGKRAPNRIEPPARSIARREIDERALRETIEELVSCGTRQSLSSWDDPKRGVGYGRDQVVARFQKIAQSTGGRLEVRVDRFEATSPRTRGVPARLENVLAFLSARWERTGPARSPSPRS